MSNNPLIHIFGEVLIDHFPDGSDVLGGAPFNVAWHLQAFGQAPRFISRIGNDLAGHEIATLMDTWGMNRDAVQKDCKHPTGSVRVIIKDGEPYYDIVADSAYDFIDTALLEKKDTAGILYHGSLAIRNPVSLAALQVIKASHQGKVFIDINLRQPWWELEILVPLLHDADWVKLNELELAALCPEGFKDQGLEKIMQAFCAQFDLETLVVTCGAKGAAAYDKQLHFITVEPPASTPVIDTVGAGDAFASVLLLGLSKQWPVEVTLDRAQAFACALVGRRGATVTDKEFYQLFSEQWH
ncbi:carbohydrate kinase [Methylobacter sp. S3L5C]|uniref:carbohydrate kinase family protein n=1 Tax=Methylobacter sp. S3L5C TaxID=2839024 RepID=UPI001FAE14F8|nr:carbohydrate kinase [Methylobacter sp. S3L5C]UOA10055.1 carbohydrate kinase [Methylobacter sp. S3L5C]